MSEAAHVAAQSSHEDLLAAVGKGALGTSIASISTVRSRLQPNVLQVLVTDSDGVTGLGETFYGASVVEAHIHDVIVPTLQSEKPTTDPAAVLEVLAGYVGYSGSGAEVRARSAVDIALWDIAAKRAGLPLAKLLNPTSPLAMPVYNTCSGNMYVNAESRQSSRNWGIGEGEPPEGSFEDLWSFLNRPGELAKELVAAGYPGMKVWPFDLAAEEARGGPDLDLRFGLSVIEAIRDAVGDKIDIYIELHSLLGLDAALTLARELERFEPTWIEDPIRADRMEDLAALHDSTSLHVAVGENLGSGANGYPRMIDENIVDTVILDVGWCGGITEALPLQRRSADAGLGIAFHDCTGPVSLGVAGALSAAAPNSVVQEVARAFWHGWYPEMAQGVPDIAGGVLHLGDAPGHGVSLLPDFVRADHTTVRTVSVT
jgi:L-alanine-DL-glutamate epimerase-like enolase superfamily enzyme